jgi:transcriptional regulator with XRE-family HTH domain
MSTGVDRREFGDTLRRLRVATGLTQEEVAERCELSVRAISNLECGRTARPRPSTMRRIAKVLESAAAQAGGSVPAMPRVPPAQLPADLADFTGRQPEVELVVSQLTASEGDSPPARAAIAVITGPGGIGKTALAVRAAHIAAQEFPDGHLYVKMHGSGSQPVSATSALARVLRDLGTDPATIPADEDELAARYRTAIAPLRLLLVLDDAQDAAQIRPLLPGAGTCAVIVTGRKSLPDLESAHCLSLLFNLSACGFFGLVSVRLTVLPTSWQVAGRRFFEPGGRPGPGVEGFGALAGTGSDWRMRR